MFGLEEAFDAAPVMLFVLGPDLRILRANRAALEFLQRRPPIGLRPGNALLCQFSDLDPRGCTFGSACQACNVRRLAADSLETRAEHRQVPTDLHLGAGDRLSLLVSTRRCDHGEEPRVLLALTDVSELRRAQEAQRRLEAEAQRRQKLESLGLLAAGIAHDFNNMLTAVSGNLDLVFRGLGDDSEHREPLQDARLAAHRAADLAQQLLAYSGRARAARGRVDVAALVGELVDMLRVTLADRARLELDLANAPTALADAAQVRQVALNLVLNAVDATPPGPDPAPIRVRVAVERCDRERLDTLRPDSALPEGDYVALVVEDHGPGMSVETLERIFDPFYTTKVAGRGLGLASVHGIVRAHAGALGVESRIGRGTTFTVLLPADGRPLEATPPPAPAPGEPTGTFLIVDDQVAVRRFIARGFTDPRSTVLLAADGEDAVAQFEARGGEVTCVVLDMGVPALPGPAVFARLRELHPDVPVVITTGQGRTEEVERLLAQPRTAFVPKPFLVESLWSAMALAMG